MKKSYLMIAAAATLLTACMGNDTFKEIANEDVMIGFETFHEKATKATSTGEISGPTNFTKAHGGFGVWGYKGTPANIVAASGSPATVDISTVANFNPVFQNVQVWYENASEPSRGFKYAVPKYWDKNMEYIFFAYAPYDAEHAHLDLTTGNITIDDIASIQNISTSTGSGEDLVFSGTSTTSVTDYLMASYEYDQKLNATNQISQDYELKGQTVGFTFGHMLSKLQINLQAKEAYSGIASLKVTNLSIENMPSSASTKASFTQTSPAAPAGVYTPSNYTSSLSIIGASGTSTSDLYILKGGSMSGETVTAPSVQNQSFYYYVAPNAPTGTGTDKYLLNISYTITYTDGITDDVVITDVDLSSKLASLLQNNSYILTIKVALNQIYFTVDAVTGWTTQTGQEIEVK